MGFDSVPSDDQGHIESSPFQKQNDLTNDESSSCVKFVVAVLVFCGVMAACHNSLVLHRALVPAQEVLLSSCPT